MSVKRSYVIGTRGSRLALWQANEAKRAIGAKTGASVEIKVISTRGDERLDISLHSNTLSKGLFTQELEDQLYSHDIDFAVHSLKDLPVEMDERLCLAAVMRREDPRDVIIANFKVSSIGDLKGQRVGTSSPRRVAQLKMAIGDDENTTEFLPIRGNVETRIAKLRSGEYDAIVMAAAGLKRLGLDREVSLYIEPEIVAPAPGQAAIGIQCAKDNLEACSIARAVDDELSHRMTGYERRLLSLLGGGCAIPFGALFAYESGRIRGMAFFAHESNRRGKRYEFVADDPLAEGFLSEIAEKIKG
ncbi:hydroxymethylbilane synthase [Porphyromonas sp.]|uniref:hydroxymethylbilane synthase n=1 Tax=Porphyromonas sp. TaxID=1924944 RepID=UPI0026DB5D5E|nr:hydroxymethylbilane synthase [Porphyromonas sp.]MDO4695326.1 hydroxymethylbilane synthase [Porphyromonas sp.]MDO4771086.1 hydroxymethylbilane synthase [Porphyromonas sp.]